MKLKQEGGFKISSEGYKQKIYLMIKLSDRGLAKSNNTSKKPDRAEDFKTILQSKNVLNFRTCSH